MSNENRPIDPNQIASNQAQRKPVEKSVEVQPTTDLGFARNVAEAVNECAEEFGHPVRVQLTEGRGATDREGPIGDLVLNEAEKVLQTMISTVGPRVISAFIAALKKRIPV